MDRVETYKGIIRRLISEYAGVKPSYGDVDVETVFDDERGHYEMLYVGWDGYRRVHGSVIHVDIRDGKVWVQFDGTEDGIAEEMAKAGIPREEIVLGFQHPYKRPYTAFAAA